MAGCQIPYIREALDDNYLLIEKLENTEKSIWSRLKESKAFSRKDYPRLTLSKEDTKRGKKQRDLIDTINSEFNNKNIVGIAENTETGDNIVSINVLPLVDQETLLQNNNYSNDGLTSKQEESINEVWKNNSKLKQIFNGNKQLYQQYLNTKTSQPILFKGFKDKSGYIHDTPNHSFFTSSSKIANKWYKDDKGVHSFYIPKGTVKEYKFPGKEGWSNWRKAEEDFINNSDADLIILHTNDVGGKQDQYVVNKNSTIVQIGSKEDIQQAKEFVDNNREILSNTEEQNGLFEIESLSEQGSDPNISNKYFSYQSTKEDLYDNTRKSSAKDILTSIGNSNHPLAPLAKKLKKFGKDIPIVLEKDKTSLSGNKYTVLAGLKNTEGITINNFELGGDHYTTKIPSENEEVLGLPIIFEKNDEEIGHEDYEDAINQLYKAHIEEYGSSAFYSPSKQEIHIAENSGFKSKDGSVESTIIHEYIHHLTHTALRNGNKTAKDLQSLYREALNHKELFNDIYPLSNIDEFVVALFTDAEFINELKNIPASNNVDNYKTLWDKLVGLFRKWFKLDGENVTLFEQAFNASTTLIEENNQEEIMGQVVGDELQTSKGEEGILAQRNFPQRNTGIKQEEKQVISKTPSEVRDHLISIHNNLKIKEVEYTDLEGNEVKGDRYFYTNEDGKEIMLNRRPSDLVDADYKRMFRNKQLTKDEEREAWNEFKRENGSKNHEDLNWVIRNWMTRKEDGTLVGKKEFLRRRNENPYTPESGNINAFNTLVDNLWDRLNSYVDGSVFLSETKMMNNTRGKKQSMGGTMDLIILEPDENNGTTINILDWKFLGLNTEKNEDIPWYKIKAWNTQMTTYRNMLIESYGISKAQIGHSRMIPILSKYGTVKNEGINGGESTYTKIFKGIQIGDPNTTNIPNDMDYLLPVPTKEETTGDKKIDKLIAKLNARYEQLSDKKVSEGERKTKALQLNSLFKAIRHLQVKGKIEPILQQGRLNINRVQTLKSRYDEIKNKLEEIEEQELSDFAVEVIETRGALSIFSELKVSLEDYIKNMSEEEKKTKEGKALLDSIDNIVEKSGEADRALSELEEEYVGAISATRYGLNSLLSPEPVVKSFARWFNATGTIPTDALHMFSKIITSAKNKADIESDDQSYKLKELHDNYDQMAKVKGWNNKNRFDIIRKKDSNELIDQFSQEFYNTAKKKIANKELGWMQDNLDIEGMNKWAQKERKKELQAIEDSGIYIIKGSGQMDDSAEKQEAIDKINKKYNIINPNNGKIRTVSPLFSDYNIIKNFPAKKWESKEYIALHKDATLKAGLDLYNYIRERNEYFASVGYIKNNQARKFLPYVRSSLIERAMLGKKLKMGKDLTEKFYIDEGVTGYGHVNEITGEIENKIPIYYTQKLPNDNEISEDIFANMVVLNHAAITYDYLNQIEGQVLALQRVERNKSHLESYSKKTGKHKTVKGNERNADLLDDMVEALLYGRKYVSSDAFDEMLGKVNLDKANKWMKKHFNFTIFPESTPEGKQISLVRSVDALNNYFSFLHLNNLNFASPLSNLMGGILQGAINSGEYFGARELMFNYRSLMPGYFHSSKNGRLKAAALEYFQFYTEDIQREVRARDLSYMKMNQARMQQISGGLLRASDRGVQAGTGITLLDNTIVIEDDNGKTRMINVNDYLKAQSWWKDRLSSGAENKAAHRKLKEEKKKLLEDKGFWKVAKIDEKSGKLSIPGIDRNSEDVHSLRTISREITRKTLGNMGDSQRKKMDLALITHSMMVFKNWIPGTVEARTGQLKYNANTDSFEWGRWISWAKFSGTNVLRAMKSLSHNYVLSDQGIDRVREMYEKEKDNYFKKRGRDLDMSFEEFYDLVERNLKGQLRDFIAVLGIFAVVTAAKALIPPPDDEDPRVQSTFNFMLRLSDKLMDEATFYYNADNALDMVTSGLFPAFATLSSASTAMGEALENVTGLILKDDELIESGKPAKYIMRNFPFAKQLTDMMPMFTPDFAEQLGVQINKTYNRR